MGDADMLAVAGHMLLAALGIDNLIVKSDRTAFHFGNPAAHGQVLAVAGRQEIAGVDFGHREVMAAAFKTGVIMTALAGVAGAAFLKVDNVAGMMDDAHRVSFSIANVETGFG